jgi:hypothetical protein
MRFPKSIYLLVLLTVLAFSVWAKKGLPMAFVEQNCMDCHGAEVAKSGLNFEALSPDLDDDDARRHWIRVFDHVRLHEMPPKKKKQPEPAARRKFLDSLENALHEASYKSQREGRVPLRRLNRTEYENTLHDLLDVAVDLKSLLPEDNQVAGFDKVSSGLGTSAVHLVRYQEAAALALSHALPQSLVDVQATKQRFTGKEWLEKKPKVYHKNIVPWSRLEGDAFVFRAQLYKHGSVHTDRTELPGRYRYRASVRAYNNGGKPLSVDVGRISTDRFGHQDLEHLLAIEAAVEGQSRTIEVEADLIAGEQVYLSPRELTLFRAWPKDRPKPEDPKFEGPELAIEWVELEGPIGLGKAYERFFDGMERVPARYLEQAKAGAKNLPDWNRWNPNEFLKPQNHLRFLLEEEDPQEVADRLIKEFLPMAIRRPPSGETLAFYLARAEMLLGKDVPLDEVLLKVYKEILCSAWFLFRIEKPGELDDYALASRLSFMLWNSMPDTELLALAKKGSLKDDKTLRSQSERMLKDWRARRFIQDFTSQWLNLSEIHEMKPDKLYSEYDEALAWSMPEETRLFFMEVLAKNLPVTEFIHSDWSFLNGRLAFHYGIPGIEGMNMRKVKLPANSHRGGLLTQASILKLTTNATYTSPIMRGAFVLDRLLGMPSSPPPPDVEAIEPDIRGAVTLREQMKAHKTQAVCASCHVKIDPPGFALENFDVLGGWRERYRVSKGGEGIDHVELPNHPRIGQRVHLARPVEAHGETASGQTFQNIDEYKNILLKDPDKITRNLARQLLVYGTGADLTFADRREVEKIVVATKSKGYGFRALLHEVVQSQIFRNK